MPSDKTALHLFNESLRRVSASDEFLDHFYHRFMASSPRLQEIFHDKDMPLIQRKLKMTLDMVAENADGQARLGMYLAMLGKTHTRLRITADMLEQWRRALIDTAMECDPEADAATASAWGQVIDDLIGKMHPAPDHVT